MKPINRLITTFIAALLALACAFNVDPAPPSSSASAALAEPYTYIELRAGQSDALPVATFAGSSLAPWVPQPLVEYWTMNAQRAVVPVAFGPLGGKFGSELSLGIGLAASGLPVEMATVAIGSTQCTAALPGGGYHDALLLATDYLLAAAPVGPFPAPLNVPWNQGQTDAQAGTIAHPRPASVYLACLRAVAAEIRAEVARVDGNSDRRVHIIVDKVQAQEPNAPSNTNVRQAEDDFAATDPDAVAIDTSPLGTSDGLHFNPPGMVTLGQWEQAASVGVPLN